MSVVLAQRPAEAGTEDGGGPARRAVVRWAWRLFRREWRQQLLVLALLAVAVAATILGTAVATNTPSSSAATFGTANHEVILAGSDPHLAADIAAIRKRFHTIDVIENQTIAIPGSVDTLDLRAQDPAGPYGRPMLGLVAGRYPSGPGEVALTHGLARPPSAWRSASSGAGTARPRSVVGLVQNPQNLTDEFALVAASQISAPTQVTILLDMRSATGFHFPSGAHVESRPGATTGLSPSAIVLILAIFGLLFIGLVAVAGFTVMGQRRLRALGMLSALGATDRNVRLVMLANGAIVGVIATLIGTALGLLGWIAYAPRLQSIAGHHVDRLNLPWWAIGTAMALAVVTAIAAAWWPARLVVRTPVVAALSGRPAAPKPAGRSGRRGAVILAIGLVALAFADPEQGRSSSLLLVVGLIATCLGGLLLAPLAIAGLAVIGRRAPIAVRIALRDLVRYRARSAAALSAITLAVIIAVIICIGATARYTDVLDLAGPNLAANQLIAYVGCSENGCPTAPPTGTKAAALPPVLAAALGTHDVVALDSAVDPRTADIPGSAGGKPTATLNQAKPENNNYSGPLYVATPALLHFYGVRPGQVDSTSDILTSRAGLAGLPDMQLIFGDAFPIPGPGGVPRVVCPAASCLPDPRIQSVGSLPAGTSEPNTVLTEHAVRTLGLEIVPTGWLIQTAHPLTEAQINAAQQIAAAAGASIETKSSAPTLSELTNWATIAAILLALGVLAMTVGLIRSETAPDLRVLTAAGASSTTRRTITGATAGALALLGALLGTAIAYLAAIAAYRQRLDWLSHVPGVDLLIIIVAMPLAATAAGWLLAGREPSTISRQPIE